MNNSDKPAMPQSVAISEGGTVTASYDFDGGEGLTKREHFATMAMQGLLSGINAATDDHHWDSADFANEAVRLSDALLAALEKQS